jgi:hypothetical protein
MLSVGRELYVQDQPVICPDCGWEGTGAQLSTGLVKPFAAAVYLYAYCCSDCGSFNVRRKAKVLAFRLSAQSEELENRKNLKRSMT